MKSFFKQLESDFNDDFVDSNYPGIKDLAAKYKVPFINGKSNAGCPGIMSPLGETPEIELSWGNGSHNADKTGRFDQFARALYALEISSTIGFKAAYLELNIHGRAMLVNIAQKQTTAGSILSAIKPYANDGLSATEVPYGKGGTQVKDIYNKYIATVLDKVVPTTTTTLSSSSSSLLSRIDLSDKEGKKKEKEKEGKKKDKDKDTEEYYFHQDKDKDKTEPKKFDGSSKFDKDKDSQDNLKPGIELSKAIDEVMSKMRDAHAVKIGRIDKINKDLVRDLHDNLKKGDEFLRAIDKIMSGEIHDAHAISQDCSVVDSLVNASETYVIAPYETLMELSAKFAGDSFEVHFDFA